MLRSFAIALVVLLVPCLALAEGPEVAVLPVAAQNVGSGTQEAVRDTIIGSLPDLGVSVVDEETLSGILGICKVPGCASEQDAASVGLALEVDIVLTIHMEREGDVVDVRLVALYVESGERKQGEGQSGMSGALSTAVSLLPAVMPEKDPCQGVACSDHGLCLVEDGKPYCDCDKGFKADGLECEEWVIQKTGEKKKKEPEVEPDIARSAMGISGAGIAFASLSLATYFAAFISVSIYQKPNGDLREGKDAAGKAWMAMHIACLATHALATPLLLGASLKVERALGRGASVQNISAWVIYGAAATTMGFAFYRPARFAFAAVTAPILISGVWVSIWEAMQARKIARRSLAMMPMVTAMPDGSGFAGLAGVF
jgi:hypothetical protein